MAIAGNREVRISFTGAFQGNSTFRAAANADSPGESEYKTLAIGANTITPPAGGSTPKGCTIVPPSGNVETITLKGVSGDTGVVLHKTDPSSIGLNSPTDTFVLTASAEIVGVQLIWS